MSQMPLVSVVIPTYNCPFLSEAINSVLAQTYENIEVIIIDDGSTDKTRETVEKYHIKVQYIYQENEGVSSARNNGIRASHGDYMAFLDADDVWLPRKIEKQMSVFKNKPNIGFVYCDNYFIDYNGRVLDNYIRKVKLLEGDILLDFFMDFFLITSGMMLKRVCLIKTGLYDKNLEVGEDFELFLRLAQHFNAGVVKEKLFKRRVWGGSLSRQDYERDFNNDISTVKKYIILHPEFYKKHKGDINIRISDLHLKFGYMHLWQRQKYKALVQFFHSIINYPNIKGVKGIIYSVLPEILLSKLQKQKEDSSQSSNIEKQ